MSQNLETITTDTISALLSYSSKNLHTNIQEILPKFSSPLKENYENRNLWLRFGLALSLSKESPRSALQAFNECIRIDQYDPLPAMLAAKLILEDLNDPDDGLELANEAIERCQRLVPPSVELEESESEQEEIVANKDNGLILASSKLIPNGQDDVDNNNHREIVETINALAGQQFDEQQKHHNYHNHKSSASSRISSSLMLANDNNTISNSKDNKPATTVSSSYYLEAKCCYKNIAPLLSRSYLLASIMHAHIYEREPESIKHFKISNLKASQRYLELAIKTYSDDYLAHFHRALHEARQKSYSSAIDNLRQAIKLNPYHVPSMQLLVLSLTALKLYDEALVLCESTLHEFEDNLLLLYIKCNLEQFLVETKGYKSALSTAQYMLKCTRKSISLTKKASTANQLPETKQPTNLFADDRSNNKINNNNQGLFIGELSVWLLVAEIFIKIGSINDAELCVDEGSTHLNGALSHQVMFSRGLIAKAKNNLIEAKSFFQSCLALCPKHANALQQIAHVHYLLGNYSTAEKFLNDSLDLDVESYKTWNYLSLVYIETNQMDKANECVKKVAVLEESSPIIPISVISRLTLE